MYRNTTYMAAQEYKDCKKRSGKHMKKVCPNCGHTHRYMSEFSFVSSIPDASGKFMVRCAQCGWTFHKN